MEPVEPGRNEAAATAGSVEKDAVVAEAPLMRLSQVGPVFVTVVFTS
jgi:hypothetical protein